MPEHRRSIGASRQRAFPPRGTLRWPGPALALAATLLLAAAVPAGAQAPRFAVGAGGGYTGYGGLTPGLADETTLEPGWLAAAQAEAWFLGGRLGTRLEGTFTRTPLEGDPDLEYDVLTATFAFLGRLLPLDEHPVATPYLVAGVGADVYRAAGHDTPIAGGVFGQDPVTRLGILAGFGVDVVPTSRWGVRLEVADRAVLPSVGESPATVGGNVMAHDIRALGMVQLRLGLPERAPRVARRAPAPAPRPVAQPRPAPEPTPQPTPEPAPEPTPQPAPPAQPRPEPAPPAARQPALARNTEAPYAVRVGDLLEVRTARLWANRIRSLGLMPWLEEQTIAGTPVARLWTGAATSERSAMMVALALRDTFGWNARPVTLEPGVSLPSGALDATEAFIRTLP